MQEGSDSDGLSEDGEASPVTAKRHESKPLPKIEEDDNDAVC